MSVRPPRDSFKRGMASLALTAGLVVGVLLPSLYAQSLFAERSAQATLWAQQVGRQVSLLAKKRPQLWSFDEAALEDIYGTVVAEPVNGWVCLNTAAESNAFCAGQPIDSPVVGRATVNLSGEAVGQIMVSLPDVLPDHDLKFVWFVAGVLGLLLTMGLYFLPTGIISRGDREYDRLWNELAETNEQLEARVVERTQALAEREQQLSSLSARLMAIQEEERTRISRDLHDELGQILTGLRLRLTTAHTLLDDQSRAAGQIIAALEVLDEGVEQVRSLAHRLRPVALDQLGLNDALSGLVMDWMSASGIHVDTDWVDAEPSSAIAEVMFRVGQEALTNVLRHAGATRVIMRTRSESTSWVIVVEDNGAGMDSGHQQGLGLLGLRERLVELRGSLQLTGSSLGGLSLTARIPKTDEIGEGGDENED